MVCPVESTVGTDLFPDLVERSDVPATVLICFPATNQHRTRIELTSTGE